jgi:hypothetical protein
MGVIKVDMSVRTLGIGDGGLKYMKPFTASGLNRTYGQYIRLSNTSAVMNLSTIGGGGRGMLSSWLMVQVLSSSASGNVCKFWQGNQTSATGQQLKNGQAAFWRPRKMSTTQNKVTFHAASGMTVQFLAFGT